MSEAQKAETPFLTWIEDFAVGERALDDEHRGLVDCINAIHAAECAQLPLNQLTPLLDLLIRQAIKHFQHENSVLRNISKRPVPITNRLAFIGLVAKAAIEEHSLGHGRTLAELNSIIKKKSSKCDISADLRDWFIDHAIKYDAHLKPVFYALNHPMM